MPLELPRRPRGRNGERSIFCHCPTVGLDFAVQIGRGDDTIHDSVIHDGLFCAFERCAMGEGTERYAASAGIARAPQDEFAA